MIVVRLSDGLGNQMFQYAMGRHLALRNDDDLRLDLAWFEDRETFGGTDRTVTLDGFDVEFTPASEEEVRSVLGGRLPADLLRLFGRFTEYAPRFFARRFNYHREIRGPPPGDGVTWNHRRRFYPGMFDIEGDIYLDGYYQVPDYFEDIDDTIREDFTVSTPPDEQNAATLDSIESTTAVAVHVRRGDQLEQGPDWSEYGNAVPPTYHRQAAAHIADRVDDPHFFVFSDDPGWCRASLDLGHPTTVVDHNDGSTDYEDVRLMRHCDHYIIANSTFSWWGAWLNDDEDKHVVAPSPWKQFGFPDGIIEEWELLPDDWTVLRY
jgi:hypothetical protein